MYNERNQFPCVAVTHNACREADNFHCQESKSIRMVGDRWRRQEMKQVFDLWTGTARKGREDGGNRSNILKPPMSIGNVNHKRVRYNRQA